MSAPNKPMNVRLTPELAERFNKLSATMPSMPRSHLLRLLLESALQGTLEEQINRVTKQLVKPEAHQRPNPHHHRVHSRV
jgi:hypothetical protein